MNRLLFIGLMFFTLLCGTSLAKRAAAPKIEPITKDGIRYTVPNDDGMRAYVQAWDAESGKKLWEVTVFRNAVDPNLEQDVQHVYLKKMSLMNGQMVLVTEQGACYTLDLKTRAVKKAEFASPEGK